MMYFTQYSLTLLLVQTQFDNNLYALNSIYYYLCRIVIATALPHSLTRDVISAVHVLSGVFV